MNYEEKYKEALKVIESLYNVVKYQSSSDALLTSQTIEKAFPELRESEDERIRKEIIQSIKDNMCVIHKEKCLVWLEKQGEQKTEIEYIYPKFRIGDVIVQTQPNGNSQPVRVLSISKKIQSYCCESDDHNVYSSIPIRCENEYKLVEQKPAEWSKEGERMCQETIDWFEKKCFPYALESENPARESIKWLKSLKDRVQLQPKQEWGEKDEKIMKRVDSLLYSQCQIHGSEYEELHNWLKSIKPNHWKPSEQNIKDLEWCADLVKDKMGVGFHRLQVFIDKLKNL
jgi:hypothetical protein